MKNTLILSIAFIGMLLMFSCENKTSNSKNDSTRTLNVKTDSSNKTSDEIKPKGSSPEWAPNIKPEMLAVIEKLEGYNDKPIADLTAFEVRKNHTPTDAVKDLINEHHVSLPKTNVDTSGKDIPVKGGKIHLRIYTPNTGNGPFPVLVYYHGGGFVIADLDVYDASASVLADKIGAVVVSVAYRLAPEHKFPTAHNDAFAAYDWVVKNVTSIKGDPKKIAVAGESAGGNLAINTAIKARDSGIMLPTTILAVYPVAASDMETPSYKKNSNAKPLNKAMMKWFVKNYLNNMSEGKDVRINLLNANLKGLPPTTIITAEIDPLQSEGMALVEKMKAAGVKVESKNYDGVTHEFFGMGVIVPQAKDAEMYAVDEMKKELKK